MHLEASASGSQTGATLPSCVISRLMLEHSGIVGVEAADEDSIPGGRLGNVVDWISEGSPDGTVTSFPAKHNGQISLWN